MSYEVERLGFAYPNSTQRSAQRPVLDRISFRLPHAGLVTIVGPNGAGKSTLLGILAGLRPGYQGTCHYVGREISEWPRRALAQRIAFLPQSIGTEFPFTVEEVVLMGRTARSGGWYDSPDDHRAAEHALSITDALAFRRRDFRSLSGGERQRVILASALAQEPECLLLDEPSTHLDLKHQIELYRMLAHLGRRMLVIAVTHDLNLALQFAQLAIVLDEGRLAANGPVEQVLTESLLREVFDVAVRLEPGQNRRPWLHYTGSIGEPPLSRPVAEPATAERSRL